MPATDIKDRLMTPREFSIADHAKLILHVDAIRRDMHEAAAAIATLEGEVERLREQMNTRYWERVKQENSALRDTRKELEEALAAANGEAESTRYLLAEEKRRAADLERKLLVANGLLGRCRPAVAVLRQMIQTAGLTSEAIAAELFEDVKTATDAAGLEVG